jgi:hypothetical protein
MYFDDLLRWLISEERFRVSLPRFGLTADILVIHGLYVFHFEHARVTSDRNARSGVNGLRPEEKKTSMKSKEIGRQQEGNVTYLCQNGPGKTLALVICMRVNTELVRKKGEFEKEGFLWAAVFGCGSAHCGSDRFCMFV